MHKKTDIARIIIISLLVSAVLIGSLYFALNYVKQRISSRLLTNYAAQEELVGKEVSSTLSVKAEGYFEDLRLIATNPVVMSSHNSGCAQALKQYSTVLTSKIENLTRVDPSDTFYCSLNASINGIKAGSIDQKLTAAMPTTNPREMISGIVESRDKPGQYVMSINEPVYNNGVFTGYLSAAVNLNDFMNNYLATIKFANTGFVSVMNADHDILYSHFTENIGKNFYSSEIQGLYPNHGLNDAILAAFNGRSTIVRYARQDIDKIASVQPLPIIKGTTWTVTVTVPQSEVGKLFINPVVDSAFNAVLSVASFFILMAIVFITVYVLHEQELLRAKSQFVSLTSHQLRTPLTAISLFSEMMDDPAIGELNETQKDYASKIRVSTARMIKLVGNILNVSRVELKRLKVEPEATDLAAFVQNQIDEVKPLADQKKVTITFSDANTSTIPLDPTLFGQVVHNLLTNAIKYSPTEDGEVGVSILHNRSNVVLRVSDNGIGIPKADRKKIFNQFYRAENARRSEGEGNGLGLYLVHALTKLTGLTVAFESNKPVGTVFYVTIPTKGMRPLNGDAKLNRGKAGI